MNPLDFLFGKQQAQHIDTARYQGPAPIVSSRVSESRAELERAINMVSEAAQLNPELKGREFRAIQKALRKL